MDDLNYLLKREQEELLRAQTAPSQAARKAHRNLAQGYDQRIRTHRLPYRSALLDGSVPFNPPKFTPGDLCA